ncbi:hypothetical protein [Flavobacterium capsici]|uniref:Uncharacterized protein n=1 Tax=Flavobacterium capsici TaxID=3075618 RepID=A0AA96ETW1_9FLAO|nr:MULTISPECIES: hypothetical protein [unclassified Flavobacterium]WNM18604.1 hypothetical protein RN608_11360 [Flavobacterium sp. PMR2A8]WNM22655.1 hypothetical protein RN605_04660 [Flavobacterium sp. PMTSA4]
MDTKTRILDTIEEAHKFFIGLDGEPKSIHKDLLLRKLDDVGIDKINVSLFELKEMGKLDFDFSANPDLIYVL